MMTYLLQTVLWTVFMAALILWPARTLAYPGGWAFIGLFAIGSVAMIAWLSKYSPRLLRERMSSPVQRAQTPWDRVWLSSFVIAFPAWLAFMSWDAARSNFTAISPWLQVLGGVGILLNFAGTWWTFRENTFAAPVVKLQEGQKVIDTGPYAIVRHPMYTSAVILFASMPLLLGSWRGLALSVVFVVALACRIFHEERTLRAELAGYEEYVARVRYRLVPFVW